MQRGFQTRRSSKKVRRQRDEIARQQLSRENRFLFTGIYRCVGLCWKLAPRDNSCSNAIRHYDIYEKRITAIDVPLCLSPCEAKDGWHSGAVGGTAVTVCLAIRIKITCRCSHESFATEPSHEKSPLVDRACKGHHREVFTSTEK